MAPTAPARAPSLTGSRLLVVSGKGGVGKTTVASVIALAAARRGMKVLLVEVEQREGFAPLFGRNRIGYDERAVAPNVTALSVIPDEALVEYLYLFYGIGRIARPLLTSKAVDFATNTAPGLRDILLVGKVKEAESRRSGGSYVYDLIVLDAPPTGRLPRFLDAPRAVVDLVRSGAIRQQAQGVLDMLQDPKRTRVVLVTLPEEMPVRETIEGVEHMRDMGIDVGPIVVNNVLGEPFNATQRRVLAKEDGEALRREAELAAIDLTQAQAAAVAAVADAHVRRAASQRRSLKDLDAVELPRLVLPAVPAPALTLDDVEVLASALLAQGAFA